VATAKPISKIAVFIAVGLAVVAAALIYMAAPDQAPGSPSASGAKAPNLSPVALAGARAFDANCAKCHGQAGLGSDKGPPFLHPVYNPGHHSDEAFHRAVRQGARAHHWTFGDMPAQPQVTDKEITEIVRYVRELQEANGIVAQPHNM